MSEPLLSLDFWLSFLGYFGFLFVLAPICIMIMRSKRYNDYLNNRSMNPNNEATE